MFSKTAHIPIIEEIAKGMQAAGMNQKYLELGIAKAKCFNRVAPLFDKSTAVDVNKYAFDFVNIRKQNEYIGSTDDFFVQNKDKFNLIFIDACHKYKNVLSDFKNSYDVLAENGLVILHDTFSPTPEWDKHCEDAYKIRYYLEKEHIETVTLPFYFGLTIVRKT